MLLINDDSESAESREFWKIAVSLPTLSLLPYSEEPTKSTVTSPADSELEGEAALTGPPSSANCKITINFLM